MSTRGHRTPTGRPAASRRERAILHRGDVTVEVLYLGPDCVTVSVTRAPRAPRRTATPPSGPAAVPAAGAVGTVAVEDALPADLDPHVRAVLDASAASRGTLLDALDARLGDDVAGVVLDQRGPSVLVTLELLPTRRARSRSARVPRPWGPVAVR